MWGRGVNALPILGMAMFLAARPLRRPQLAAVWPVYCQNLTGCRPGPPLVSRGSRAPQGAQDIEKNSFAPQKNDMVTVLEYQFCVFYSITLFSPRVSV